MQLSNLEHKQKILENEEEKLENFLTKNTKNLKHSTIDELKQIFKQFRGGKLTLIQTAKNLNEKLFGQEIFVQQQVKKMFFANFQR